MCFLTLIHQLIHLDLLLFLVFHCLDVLPIFILFWIYFSSFYIIILT